MDRFFFRQIQPTRGISTTSKTSTDVNLQEETYDHSWIIPNWATRCKAHDLGWINKQVFTFETGGISQVKTKWLVGLKSHENPLAGSTTTAHLYWKFLETNVSNEKLHVTIYDKIIDSKMKLSAQYSKVEDIVSVGTTLRTGNFTLIRSQYWDPFSGASVNSDRSITILLRLNISTPKFTTKVELVDNNLLPNKFERFSSASSNRKHCIATNDKNRLRTSKTIPEAPKSEEGDLHEVVESSLKNEEQEILTQFKQSATKAKNGDDLFILLNIKNRVMREVNDFGTLEALVMLNTVLDEADGTDVSYRHVRLLGLLQKESLKILEENLLAKIVNSTQKVTSLEEFYVVFGFKQENPSSDEGLLVRALPD